MTLADWKQEGKSILLQEEETQVLLRISNIFYKDFGGGEERGNLKVLRSYTAYFLFVLGMEPILKNKESVLTQVRSHKGTYRKLVSRGSKENCTILL